MKLTGCPPSFSISWLMMPVDGERKFVIMPTTTTVEINYGRYVITWDTFATFGDRSWVMATAKMIGIGKPKIRE